MSKSPKKILILMSGSIAGFKICSLISSLVKNHFAVEVVMSGAATQFIGPATIEGLTGKKPHTDLFESGSVMSHIHLERWADLILLAPATANTINKLSHGIADDLISSLFLAHDFKKPFLIAPAMNTEMYKNPITQKSFKTLKDMGIEFLDSTPGALACGEYGIGRLMEPENIFTVITEKLNAEPLNFKTAAELNLTTDKNHAQAVVELSTSDHVAVKKSIDLQLMGTESINTASITDDKVPTVLITSGGTSEPIDDVRTISNRSSGRTGAFLADHFISLGMNVTYLHAENAVLPTLNCEKLIFSTFKSLSEQINNLSKSHHFDYIFHAAAVSDYSLPEHTLGKIDSSQEKIQLTLIKNPKIIDSLKKLFKNSCVFGFKLTSGLNEKNILAKVDKVFQTSQADYVIQNDWKDIQNHQHTFNLYKKNQGLLASKIYKDALALNLSDIIFKETL